jgi:hypothetical protein
MSKIKLFVIILITVLVAGNVCFGVFYFLNCKELNQYKKEVVIQQDNTRVFLFADLFIDKVLLGQGTVSFEDRLSLENAVRDIKDNEIFSKWEQFTDSQDDRQSQSAVGNLLKLLFAKVAN